MGNNYQKEHLKLRVGGTSEGKRLRNAGLIMPAHQAETLRIYTRYQMNILGSERFILCT